MRSGACGGKRGGLGLPNLVHARTQLPLGRDFSTFIDQGWSGGFGAAEAVTKG